MRTIFLLVATFVGSSLYADAAMPADRIVQKVPVTNAEIGDFPYFTWPAHDKPQNPATENDDGYFPFWYDHAFHLTHGKTYMVTVLSATNQPPFDERATRSAFEHAFVKAGAVKIASARIPSATILRLPEADRRRAAAGLGDPYNDPVETWLIHRNDRLIWISFTSDSAGASLAVVEAPTDAR